MRCGFIGAGLSALTCAGELRAAGWDVTLFDKGRGPGGRLSTHHMVTPYGDAHVDHGAPCFEVSDPGFREAVEGWWRAGLVVPWPAGGPDAWVGIPRMASIAAHLAAPHGVVWNTFAGGILRNARGEWHISSDRGFHGPFDAVVTAVPAEQAVPILALYDLEMARTAANARSCPCWSGVFVFQDELPVSAHPRRDQGPIALALCNRAKPGRAGPEAWVVHASPEWSAAHLERAAAEICPLLLAALGEILALSALPRHHAAAHRWRYATADGIGRTALWNPDLKLGACGDWLMGPRAEGAWLSGRNLACAMNESSVAAGAAKPPGRSSDPERPSPMDAGNDAR